LSRGRPAKRNPIVFERPRKPRVVFELDPRSSTSRRFDGERRLTDSSFMRAVSIDYDAWKDEP
jgi:hypothetical protein